jgi:hypothetical protein
LPITRDGSLWAHFDCPQRWQGRQVYPNLTTRKRSDAAGSLHYSLTFTPKPQSHLNQGTPKSGEIVVASRIWFAIFPVPFLRQNADN